MQATAVIVSSSSPPPRSRHSHKIPDSILCERSRGAGASKNKRHFDGSTMADDNNDTAAAGDSAPAATRPPRLYIVKLYESPHPDNNYDRYSMQWILDTAEGDDDVQQGDMLYIPEVATGAGETEGLRFVGTNNNNNNGFALWSGGIEAPVFPRGIAELKSPQELRRDYEQLLNIVLQQQGFSLADLFGGDEVVEEFWASPDTERQARETEGEWHIPWSQCEILSTHDGS